MLPLNNLINLLKLFALPTFFFLFPSLFQHLSPFLPSSLSLTFSLCGENFEDRYKIKLQTKRNSQKINLVFVHSLTARTLRTHTHTPVHTPTKATLLYLHKAQRILFTGEQKKNKEQKVKPKKAQQKCEQSERRSPVSFFSASSRAKGNAVVAFNYCREFLWPIHTHTTGHTHRHTHWHSH